MKLLIKLIPFLVIAWLIYSLIRRRSSVKLSSSAFNTTKQLSKGIYLEKTHSGEYTLNDKDGFGLVYGKVLELGFEKAAKKELYVKYRHAKNEETLYAMIDLETLEVKNLQEKEVPIPLAEIQSFY